jgi:hypothetical protein
MPLRGNKRLAGDDRSSGYGLQLRLSRAGWLAVATAGDAALPEWGPSGRGHGRNLGGQAQVAHVAGDVLGFLDQRDQPHLAAAMGAGLDLKVETRFINWPPESSEWAIV